MALEKFVAAPTFGKVNESTTMIHVSQTNNGVCSIGRDINFRFKHSSIKRETPEMNQNEAAKDRMGRLCVTLWGYTDNCI
jgi:biotin carboxylase